MKDFRLNEISLGNPSRNAYLERLISYNLTTTYSETHEKLSIYSTLATKKPCSNCLSGGKFIRRVANHNIVYAGNVVIKKHAFVNHGRYIHPINRTNESLVLSDLSNAINCADYLNRLYKMRNKNKV